jgi:D-3-phosphoglycerate dehydrogenase
MRGPLAPTVVALGKVAPELVEEHLPGDVRFVAEPGPDDLARAVGAIVRADPRVDAALLDRMPHLRVIARTGVGVDRVDLEEASRRGIVIVVTPGTGTHAVAEGTLAMVLHLVKQLRWSTACVAEGRWEHRDERTLGDLEGSVIGIVGYGRIGRRVGDLARAFGMTVLAHDPFAEPGPEMVDLDELRRRSHVITLHLPLTDSTGHLVDDTFLRQVLPGTVLVNSGRGGLLDLDAAQTALDDGRLSGLGLDVFDPEPPPHHPVFHYDNVVLSPHLMGLSASATRATFAAAARGITDVLQGRLPAAVVNTGPHDAPHTVPPAVKESS